MTATALDHNLGARLQSCWLQLILVCRSNTDATGMEQRAATGMDKEEPAASNTPICRFVFLIILIIVVPMSGAVFFIVDEDWDFASAFYMAFTTCTTVGYGDYSPQTEHGRMFGIFWIVIGVVLFGNAISEIAELAFHKKLALCQKSRLRRPISGPAFASFAGQDHQLDIEEYTVLKLLAQGKISDKDLNRCAAEFRKIDKRKRGFLELQDVRAHFFHSESSSENDQVMEPAATKAERIDPAEVVNTNVLSAPNPKFDPEDNEQIESFDPATQL